MKLKIRYEKKYEILEVSSEEMWVSLSLEGGEDLTEEETIILKSWILEFFNKETPQPNDKAINRLINWLKHLGG